jgi:hypothetical protein
MGTILIVILIILLLGGDIASMAVLDWAASLA